MQIGAWSKKWRTHLQTGSPEQPLRCSDYCLNAKSYLHISGLLQPVGDVLVLEVWDLRLSHENPWRIQCSLYRISHQVGRMKYFFIFWSFPFVTIWNQCPVPGRITGSQRKEHQRKCRWIYEHTLYLLVGLKREGRFRCCLLLMHLGLNALNMEAELFGLQA